MSNEALIVIGQGVEAEVFLQSALGKALIARAEQEREVAIDLLKSADAEDAAGIRALQNQIYRAESIQGWLAEIVMAGRNTMAHERLRDQDE